MSSSQNQIAPNFQLAHKIGRIVASFVLEILDCSSMDINQKNLELKWYSQPGITIGDFLFKFIQ